MSNHIVETYYVDDDCHIRLEEYDNILFIHADVNNTKPSTIKLLREGFKDIKWLAYMCGHDHIYSYTKNKRFAKILGKYEEVSSFCDEVHGEYEVIRWDLKQ